MELLGYVYIFFFNIFLFTSELLLLIWQQAARE